MQKDKQDTQRTDILHQEDVQVEISAYTQRATIGELIMNQLMGHEPANQNTGQETNDWQENLSRHKVEDIKQCLLEEVQRRSRGTQRERTDDAHHTTRDRNDDGRCLTGNAKLLVEKRGAYLMKRDQGGKSCQRQQ